MGEPLGRVWCVWVSANAEDNFWFGLKRGVWGYKDEPGGLGRLNPGDRILFAFAVTSARKPSPPGYPRLPLDTFLPSRARYLVEANLLTGAYRDETVGWPDGGSYPYCIQIHENQRTQDVLLSEASYPRDVLDAIRRSGLDRGRPYPAEARESSVWLFQANPKLYDLRERLKHLDDPQDDWSVNRYRAEMRPGDRVVLWESGERASILALGELLSSPKQRDNPPPYVNTDWAVDYRITRVLDRPITRDDCLDHPVLRLMQVLRSPQGTNFRVSSQEWAAIEDMMAMEPLTMDWLTQETLWPQERLEKLCRAIEQEKTVLVLQGPPGTGKTWVAMRVAEYLNSQRGGQTDQVQFHPSYAYEDFIEGLRPVAGANNVLEFKRTPGKLLQFIEQVKDTNGLHILIIDEINRGNLPRIFGELLFLIEYRDEKPISLQYSPDRKFSLPPSIKFIGTMNTADRSTRSLDSALRRRFQMFKCPPDPTILSRYYETHENAVGNLVQGFEKLNKELEDKLGDRHHTIGHTFFMVPDGMTRQKLEDIWEYRIFPLIEEYFYDQRGTVDAFRLEEYWEK